jgi:hypothetical protein
MTFAPFCTRGLLLVAVVLMGLVARGDSATCTQPDTAVPDAIQVAVLVWADSDEVVLSQPISSYAPIPTTSAGFASPAPSLLQPFYLGVEFYKKRLQQIGSGRVPVRGGSASIALNISYINLGRVNWNTIVNDYPLDGFMSIMAASMPGGLFDQLVDHASLFLGENKTFTFFVPHPFMGDMIVPLLNRVEDHRGASDYFDGRIGAMRRCPGAGRQCHT